MGGQIRAGPSVSAPLLRWVVFRRHILPKTHSGCDSSFREGTLASSSVKDRFWREASGVQMGRPVPRRRPRLAGPLFSQQRQGHKTARAIGMGPSPGDLKGGWWTPEHLP